MRSLEEIVHANQVAGEKEAAAAAAKSQEATEAYINALEQAVLKLSENSLVALRAQREADKIYVRSLENAVDDFSQLIDASSLPEEPRTR